MLKVIFMRMFQGLCWVIFVCLLSTCTQVWTRHPGPPAWKKGGSLGNWWGEPIFLGRGELALEGGPSASTQENYERFIRKLAMQRLDPGTIVLADKWCESRGDPRPDHKKWPNMRGFIEKRRQIGEHVLLCFHAGSPEGLPPEECLQGGDGSPAAGDPTNPSYKRRLLAAVRRMLSRRAGCLDADGLLLMGVSRRYGGLEKKACPPLRGTDLAAKLLGTIRKEAKRIKPDALLISDPVDPLLGREVDMILLDRPPEKRGAAGVSPLTLDLNEEARLYPGKILAFGGGIVSGRKEWNTSLRALITESNRGMEKMKAHEPGAVMETPVVCPVLDYVDRAGLAPEDRFGWEDIHDLRRIWNDFRWKFKWSHPLSIRRIRPKVESFSPLAPGQVIAQPFIQPIVSSGGYDTKGLKRAIVWLNDTRDSGTFEVIDVTRNLQDPTRQAVSYRGSLVPAGRHAWGGNTLIADFSGLRRPGFYIVRVHLDRTIEVADSTAFPIEDGLCLRRAAKAGHFFYYQRCGVDIPGMHKACHTSDGILPDGRHKDFTGGWHDGGDYNKWSHYGYYGVLSLLELADLEKDIGLKDPSPLPSPVDEADWECSFLLKVITPEGHLISLYAPGPNPWVWLGRPELEPTRMARVENGASPSVTGWTAAALARMALHAPSGEKADKYKKAAKFLYGVTAAWGPGTPQYKIYRRDFLDVQASLLMADLAFMEMKEGPENFESDAASRVDAILGQQDRRGFFYADKERTSKLVFLRFNLLPLYLFVRTPLGSSRKREITDSFVRWADFIWKSMDRTPFHQVGFYDFSKGTSYLAPNGNIPICSAGWALATTAILTGNPRYLEKAWSHILWVLGLNPTGLSMMAGVGSNPRCFHHRCASIPGRDHALLPGGILNGIDFPRKGRPLVIGDLNTQNYVLGDHLPLGYPVLDDDVFGWTWGYGTNEYWTPNNGYFILMACQIEKALRIPALRSR